jgi:hypothetical protein
MGIGDSFTKMVDLFRHSNGSGRATSVPLVEDLRKFEDGAPIPRVVEGDGKFTGIGRSISQNLFVFAKSLNDKVGQLEKVTVAPVELTEFFGEALIVCQVSGGQDSVAVIESLRRLMGVTGEKVKEVLGFYVVSDGFSNSEVEDNKPEGSIYWNAKASRLLVQNSLLGVLNYFRGGNFKSNKIIRAGIESAKKEIIGSATYTSALLTREGEDVLLETFSLGDSPVYAMGIRNGQPVLLKLSQSDSFAESFAIEDWCRGNSLVGKDLLLSAQDFYERNSFDEIRQLIQEAKNKFHIGDELVKSFKAIVNEEQKRKSLKFNLSKLFDKRGDVMLYVGSDMIDKILGEGLYIDYLFNRYKDNVNAKKLVEVGELGDWLGKMFHSAELDDSGFVLKSVTV